MVDPDHNRRRVPAATPRRSITSVEPIARNLHALGTRLLGELLLELCGDDADKWARVERYAGMNPSILAIFGGDRYPARPSLRVVGGRRHG
jgi:hypothetical protein